MELAIAIDIGGTNTKLGIVNQQGAVLHKATFATRHFPGTDLFFKQLVLETEKLVGWAKSPSIVAGIGLGAPKANYFTGIVTGAVNLRWQQPLNLKQQLQTYFDLPVFVTKDANLAALGEKYYGAARSMNNFISVTLGTGVGAGIYIDGRLLHGQSDGVGELGHTSVKKKGRYCSCGRRGCLETYVSAYGISRTALEQLGISSAAVGTDVNLLAELSPHKLHIQAQAGNRFAQKVFATTGKLLGYKLADLIALFNPEAVFISGGIANAGQLLLEPALTSIKKHLYGTYPDQVQLLPSALPENDISLLGGGALVWEQLEKESFMLV